MEKASSCILSTNTYIPVAYLVFLTIEVVWKLAIIRVINNSHKHSYHAPVASWFLAYILTSLPEQKRKTEPKQQQKKRQKQITHPQTWFQIDNFEKVCLASLKTLHRSSSVSAGVKSTLFVERDPVLSGFSEAMQRSVYLSVVF